MSKRRFWTNDISVMDGTIQRQWVKRHCSKHFSQVWVFLIHPYLAEIPADWRHSLSHPLNPMPQFAFLQPKLFPITFWNNKFLLLQEAKTPRPFSSLRLQVQHPPVHSWQPNWNRSCRKITLTGSRVQPCIRRHCYFMTRTVSCRDKVGKPSTSSHFCLTPSLPLLIALHLFPSFAIYLLNMAVSCWGLPCCMKHWMGCPHGPHYLEEITTASSTLSILLPSPFQNKETWTPSGICQRQRTAMVSPPSLRATIQCLMSGPTLLSRLQSRTPGSVLRDAPPRMAQGSNSGLHSAADIMLRPWLPQLASSPSSPSGLGICFSSGLNVCSVQAQG